MVDQPAESAADSRPDPQRFAAQAMELVLQYGQQALDAMASVGPPHRQMVDQLVEQGLLIASEKTYRLTARAVTAIERQALVDVFARIQAERNGRATPDLASPSYVYGETVTQQDVVDVMRSILVRGAAFCPVGLDEQALNDYLANCDAPVSAALLLDMSGAMGQFGRFLEAKRIALALHALIRQRFPNDTLDVIGFYSLARRIDEQELPLLMPQPVTVFDYQYARQLPVAQADQAPGQFANLQMALQLARESLADRPGEHKLVLLVAGGGPTARIDDDQLVLTYPTDPLTTRVALQEAGAAARSGIRFANFALIDDYHDMDWVGFVDQMTRLTRGASFYCGSDDLPGCVLESYLAGKRH